MKNHFQTGIHTELLELQLNTPNNDTTTYYNTESNSNKIQIYDLFSINHILISDKLKKVPFSNHYYDLYENYNFINIGLLNEKVLDYYDIIDPNKDDKYLVFQHKKEKLISFFDFMFHLPTPKLFIFHLIDSYSHLLKGLTLLKTNNFCFFNISSETVAFNTGFKPILQNFHKSVRLDALNEQLLQNIFGKTDDYALKPIETHVLFHLLNNNEETVSYSLLYEICNNYVSNHSILELFPPTYKDVFFQNCLNSLKPHVNKHKHDIITEICKYSYTWDNYSLSLLYLHIVGLLNKTFSLKEGFTHRFLILLFKNTSPDPLKRETLENTERLVSLLYDEYCDWRFVNELSYEKYIKMLETY